MHPRDPQYPEILSRKVRAVMRIEDDTDDQRTWEEDAHVSRMQTLGRAGELTALTRN